MSVKEKLVKLPLNQIRFLDICAELELKFAKLYYHFAEIHAENTELALLWRKTAREEEDHARQFHLASRLKGLGMQSLTADMNQAVIHMQETAEIIVQLLASSPSPEAALLLAVEFEERMDKYHMSSVVLFSDPQLKKLFEAMMKNDQEHVSMLQDAQKIISLRKDQCISAVSRNSVEEGAGERHQIKQRESYTKTGRIDVLQRDAALACVDGDGPRFQDNAKNRRSQQCDKDLTNASSISPCVRIDVASP